MHKLLGSVCLLVFSTFARAEELTVILQRMNEMAPRLHTLTADIHLLTYTAVIQDTLTENGTLKMQKAKDNSTRAVLDFSGVEKSSRVIGLYGSKVQMYFPNSKYYRDYDFGKKGDVINQFLLLGFGASGDELSKSYTIKAEGTEKIAGMTTTKLLLVPKSADVKEKLSRAELWIPEGQANPIQQEFYEDESGNYRKVSYSNVVVNPTIKGRLEIQMLPGTRKDDSN